MSRNLFISFTVKTLISREHLNNKTTSIINSKQNIGSKYGIFKKNCE